MRLCPESFLTAFEGHEKRWDHGFSFMEAQVGFPNAAWVLDHSLPFLFVLLRFENVRCSFFCLTGSRARVISFQSSFVRPSGVTWFVV